MTLDFPGATMVRLALCWVIALLSLGCTAPRHVTALGADFVWKNAKGLGIERMQAESSDNALFGPGWLRATVCVIDGQKRLLVMRKRRSPIFLARTGTRRWLIKIEKRCEMDGCTVDPTACLIARSRLSLPVPNCRSIIKTNGPLRSHLQIRTGSTAENRRGSGSAAPKIPHATGFGLSRSAVTTCSLLSV